MTVLALLTVLAVLDGTLPSFCFSYKIQCQETVLTVLAVVAVPVVTATPLKLNPPFSSSCPKDPAELKIVRVVNLLRVLFLVRRGDLLSRHILCGHRFPGNYRHFSSQRRVHGVLNLGGVVKTLRRSNSLFLLSS